MDFTKARPADNRAVLEKAARTDARKGRAPGLIAYRGRRGDRLGQPGAAGGLRAPRALDGAGSRRREAGLVDRLLRGGSPGAWPGRGERSAGRRDRVRARSRRDPARGVSGRRGGRRSHSVGERLHGHALDVRTRRVHGGRRVGRRTAPSVHAPSCAAPSALDDRASRRGTARTGRGGARSGSA